MPEAEINILKDATEKLTQETHDNLMSMRTYYVSILDALGPMRTVIAAISHVDTGLEAVEEFQSERGWKVSDYA